MGTASAAANVTITNTGTAPLVVSSTAVTAGGSDFSVAGTCTTTVMAGAICTLPVTFTPSHASSIDGQLTLITNAGTQVVALSGTGVGTGIGGGLILNAVYSRKIHGAAGPFNLVIDTSRQINQPVTVEPRSGAAGHLIVFLFNQPIAQPGTVAAVDAMNAPVGNITGFSIQGSEVHVALSGVPDNKRLTLSLAGVNGSGSAQVSIGFMIGDTNSSGGVNAADICSIKARSGQAVNAATARFDLNLSGTISSQDVSMVKTRAGWRLP